MVRYRRNFVQGGSWFFTVALRNRRSDLLVRRIDLLRDAFRQVLRDRPLCTEAVVVLPDHVHALWTLPPGDADYPGRWRALKSAFVRALAAEGLELERDHRGEAAVWQRRYWEHTIRDADDLQRHVDYIHYNPVRHGLVERASDWPYSSIHRYIETGSVGIDWAGPPAATTIPETGEPW